MMYKTFVKLTGDDFIDKPRSNERVEICQVVCHTDLCNGKPVDKKLNSRDLLGAVFT